MTPNQNQKNVIEHTEGPIDDPVVQAKKNAAEQMGKENRMSYFMIPGKQVETAKTLQELIKT